MAASNDNGDQIISAQDPSPLFHEFQELTERFSAPYSPPLLPQTKDEALFLLSAGGADLLGEVYEFLRRYRDLLRKGWNDEAPVYMEGFGKLSEWLVTTLNIGFVHDYWEKHIKNKTFLIIERMHDFARSREHLLDVEQIDNLRFSVLAISTLVAESWHYGNYFALVLQRLEDNISKTPLCQGNSLADEEVNRAQKQFLYEQMQKNGLFDVHFLEVTFEGETREIYCQEFDTDYRELRAKFGDFNTTLRDIIHYLKPLVGKAYFPDLNYLPMNSGQLYDNAESSQYQKSIEIQQNDSKGRLICQNMQNMVTVNSANTTLPTEHKPLPIPVSDSDLGKAESTTSQKSEMVCEQKPRLHNVAKREYSEYMSKKQLFDLANQHGTILTQKGLVHAIRNDPECCVSQSRKHHKFDMNHESFKFLKDRKKG